MSEIDEIREDMEVLTKQISNLQDVIANVSKQHGLGPGPAEAMMELVSKFEHMRDKLATYEKPSDAE
jgi:prefoldin subunit 5